MALLEDVKLSMGISHNKKDTDISTTINACKLDLSTSGVSKVEESDPLVAQAIKLYCWTWYNYQGLSERWERAYTGLRDSMALSGDYNGGGGAAT